MFIIVVGRHTANSILNDNENFMLTIMMYIITLFRSHCLDIVTYTV